MTLEIDYVPFATGAGANVLSQASYAAGAATTAGFSAGVASSAYFNKVWRQSSVVAAAFATFISAQANISVLDDGNVANLVTNYETALNAYVTANAGLVHIAGAETITGAKTFSATLTGSRMLLAGATDDTVSDLQIGPSANAATTTPASINLGASYSPVAGANPKLQLYNLSGAIVGIGISAGQMDFILPSTAFTYNFYQAGANLLQINSGNATFSVIPQTAVAPTSGNHLTNKTYVDGKYASPPAIGNTTPNTGAFTTLSATTSTSAGALTATSASLGTSANTSAPNFNAGSMVFQCYSLNNVWFGDNFQYSGATWQYVSAGYAERIYFLNGDITFSVYASGAASAALPGSGASCYLKISQAGFIALGTNITTSQGSTAGAAMLVGGANVSIGVAISTAGYLTIAPTTAAIASLILQPSSGVLNTTPVNGAFENDGTHLYFTSGGVRTNLLAPSAASTGFAFGGDGSDGSVTISTNTTLTRDMFYSSLTINAGITLKTGNCRIYCTGTVTIAATAIISNNGAAASGSGGGFNSGAVTLALGGSGGNGSSTTGAAGSITQNSYGGSGAAGGAGTSAAGAAGTATAPSANNGSIRSPVQASLGVLFSQAATAVISITGGGGGSAGGGGSGGSGGGGGGGGGIVLISAANIVNNGTIQAVGGVGAAGTGTNCGGGGGGGGGCIILLTSAAVSGSGTTSVAGGAGGAAGGGVGVAGTSGAAGTIVQIVAT